MAETTLISVRINNNGLAALDEMAEEEGTDRSVLVRALLGEAVRARLARRSSAAASVFLERASKRSYSGKAQKP